MKELQQNHDKQNGVYISAKAELFSKSNKMTDELDALANDRLDKLCEVMAGIPGADIEAAASYVETVDLFVSFFDDVVLECAELTGRRAEIEYSIIELCKKALEKPTKDGARNSKDEHVTARFIDCMVSNSKDMAAALLDDTNPLRLGLTLYVDICEKSPEVVNAQALDYLKTEAEVRKNLIKGNDQAAFTSLEKLLASPVDSPEKYLLTSMNSFYHGFEKDARIALEIGLKNYPGNERLLSAKGALGR